MTLFSILFAIIILGTFWGGFIFMLFYTLKLKERPISGLTVDPESAENEENS